MVQKCSQFITQYQQNHQNSQGTILFLTVSLLGEFVTDDQQNIRAAVPTEALIHMR